MAMVTQADRDKKRSEALRKAIVDFRKILHELDKAGFTQADFAKRCKVVARGLSAHQRQLTPPAGSPQADLLAEAQELDAGLGYSSFQVNSAFGVAELSLIRRQQDVGEKISNFPTYLAARISLDPNKIALPSTEVENGVEFPWWKGDLKSSHSPLASEIVSSKKSFADIWTAELGPKVLSKGELGLD